MKAIKKRRLYLGKGLNHKIAWARACRKAKADFRGMNYNKTTGWATLI